MYISHKHKVLFMPIPKSGCTTTKRLLWYMDSGFIPKGDIHNAHVTKEFNNLSVLINNAELDDYYKFCVVRDPVNRLISAYNHRVLVLGEIKNSQKVNNTTGLPNEPTFKQFVRRLGEYKKKVPVINHHVLPMHEFIGEDPNFYYKIYKLSNINSELIPLLEKKCGHDLKLDMTINKSPHVVKREDLSKELIDKIKTIYQKDYDIYGKYL